MRYHLRAADSEWAIERSGEAVWVLNQQANGAWNRVGVYKSANEAAVRVGAQMADRERRGKRHLARLQYVLSAWERS